MTDEPKLLAEPREGVPNVIDTLPAFRDYCSELASSHGSLAADAERASGFRYGHEDWLVQFKRDGAGIGLLDPQALAAAARIAGIAVLRAPSARAAGTNVAVLDPAALVPPPAPHSSWAFLATHDGLIATREMRAEALRFTAAGFGIG